MDPELTVTAADLINGLNKGELNELFTKLGGERLAGRIAQAICLARRIKPIRTTVELAEIIRQAKPRQGHLDPATKVFQALRIAVNDELNNLQKGLEAAFDLLDQNGRLVVISFHQGEDRIVKQFFKEKTLEKQMAIITKKPIKPNQQEVFDNPRSRSARLRVGEKL
jgi:16S rRNA (cytosine1402-N4)-methyltransferase